MAAGPYDHAAQSRHPRASLILGVGCWAAAVVVLYAFAFWFATCEDGVFNNCLGGHPSAELVLQAVLAVACLVATLVAWLLSRSRMSLLPAIVLAAAAAAIFLVWLVFVDAATHGWDDLKLLGGRSHELHTPGH
jgi:hypothetical protein